LSALTNGEKCAWSIVRADPRGASRCETLIANE
jgi:hypothetical protein